MMRIKSLCVFFVFLFNFVAKGDVTEPKCQLCRSIERIEVEFSHAHGKAIERSINLFENVDLSKNEEVRRREIAALLRLAALTLAKIPKEEDDGRLDEYLYDIYFDYQKEMKPAIEKLDPAQRAIINKSIQATARGLKDGNG